MNKLIVRTGLMGLVAVTTLALGGCNNNLKDENEQLRTSNTKLTTENEDYKTKLTQSESARGEAENKAAASQGTISTLQTQLAEKNNQPPNYPPAGPGTNGGGSGAKKRNGGGDGERIVVAGDVLFSPGSVTLTAAGKKELDKVVTTIKSKHPGDTVRVEGYTDSDPIKKSPYASNKALSQARAESVEKYMATKGISASRISAIGMGEAKAMSSKAASRRVEIVVVDTNN